MAESKSSGKTKDLVALTSVPLIMVLGNSMLIPVLPQIKSALKISQFQVSLLITLFSLTAGIVIPLAGFLSDRISRKAVIIPSVLLYGAGGLLAGFAALWVDKPYALIIAGRALQGLGAAGTAPIAMALLGDLFRGGAQSRALGLSESANGMGKVISPIAGSLLGLIAWWAPFFAFPILCAVSALMVWLMVKEPVQKEKSPSLREYVRALGDIFKREGRWLLCAFFAGSAGLFVLFGILFYLSEVLESQYQIDGVWKGGVLAIPLLGMVVTSFVTGSLIRKNGKLMKFLIITGLFALSGSLALAILFKNLYLFIGLITLGSIGTGAVLPCLNSFITGAVRKAERGMITSIYGSVRFLGVAIGPPVFSWLMDISRTVMLASVASLVAFAALLGLFLIHPAKNGGQTEKNAKRKKMPFFPSHLIQKRARGRVRT
ncbi:MAG: MFS transporter [Bacillus thermozeamaize]|uniref:MFS transporter n=1 Tax=Bacillus thermozeamaize TaxID=230954 RepID=A0A1Y3PI14_9BACI|nr:MAG: MFS transporter [Bacillus thermozeamaize]